MKSRVVVTESFSHLLKPHTVEPQLITIFYTLLILWGKFGLCILPSHELVKHTSQVKYTLTQCTRVYLIYWWSVSMMGIVCVSVRSRQVSGRDSELALARLSTGSHWQRPTHTHPNQHTLKTGICKYTHTHNSISQTELRSVSAVNAQIHSHTNQHALQTICTIITCTHMHTTLPVTFITFSIVKL